MGILCLGIANLIKGKSSSPNCTTVRDEILELLINLLPETLRRLIVAHCSLYVLPCVHPRWPIDLIWCPRQQKLLVAWQILMFCSSVITDPSFLDCISVLG